MKVSLRHVCLTPVNSPKLCSLGRFSVSQQELKLCQTSMWAMIKTPPPPSINTIMSCTRDPEGFKTTCSACTRPGRSEGKSIQITDDDAQTSLGSRFELVWMIHEGNETFISAHLNRKITFLWPLICESHFAGMCFVCFHLLKAMQDFPWCFSSSASEIIEMFGLISVEFHRCWMERST